MKAHFVRWWMCWFIGIHQKFPSSSPREFDDFQLQIFTEFSSQLSQIVLYATVSRFFFCLNSSGKVKVFCLNRLHHALTPTLYEKRFRTVGVYLWSKSLKFLPLVFLGTSPVKRMLVVGCLMMVSLLDLKFKEYWTWKNKVFRVIPPTVAEHFARTNY